ncbi:hypothetical protein AMJ80_07670 [bacterium SM23_31]|nr:MAG: hypothetical protein AMJ80_07670 [bacterium SM23_31]
MKISLFNYRLKSIVIGIAAVLIFGLSLSSRAWGQTKYYIDATNGNDNNSGKSAENAWKTIDAVNDSMGIFLSGDSVLFKRGEVWREQLNISASEVLFGAYGTGNNPVITGADTAANWDEFLGNMFESDTLMGDDFESGDMSYWTSAADSSLAKAEASKFGSYGLSHNIQSIAEKLTYKAFTEHDTTYTSFFFKIRTEAPDSFTMADGDNFVVSNMRNQDASGNDWRLRLRRSGSDYQIALYRPFDIVGNWVTVNRGQWYWIKVKWISIAAGSCEWWIDGVSKGNYSGDLSGKTSGRFYVIKTEGLGAGTSGKLYFDQVQVTLSNHNEPTSGGGANLWSINWNSRPIAVFFELKDSTTAWGDSSMTDNPDTEYEWKWDSQTDKLIIYSETDPDTTYQSVEATTRNYGIRTNANVNNITIENLEIKYAETAGIQLADSCVHWTIQNNKIHHIGDELNEEGSAILSNDADSSKISDNIVYEAGRHGIFIDANDCKITDYIIENNTVYNCYHNSIDLHSTSNIIDGIFIRYNTVYYTNDAPIHAVNGIFLQGYSGSHLSNAKVYYNVIFNMPSAGINVGQYTNRIYLYNNTVYHTRNNGYTSECIFKHMNADTLIMKNNIFVNNVKFALYIQDTILLLVCYSYFKTIKNRIKK